MTMYKPVLSVAAAAAFLGVVSMPAQALISTFGFNTTGTVTYTPGPPSTVDLATQIDVVPPPPVSYRSNGTATGFFAGLPANSVISLSGNSFTSGTGVDFTMHLGADFLTFTSQALTATLGPGTNNGSIATNAWTETGTLTDSLGLLGPTGAVGQLSLSAIQNLNPFSPNPNASWTASFQNLPPPPPSTPEPGSVAMLVGLGLSGAGFMIRRRK